MNRDILKVNDKVLLVDSDNKSTSSFKIIKLMSKSRLGLLYTVQKTNDGKKGLLFEFYPLRLSDDIVRIGDEITYKLSVYDEYLTMLRDFGKVYEVSTLLNDKINDFILKPNSRFESEDYSFGKGTKYIFYEQETVIPLSEFKSFKAKEILDLASKMAELISYIHSQKKSLLYFDVNNYLVVKSPENQPRIVFCLYENLSDIDYICLKKDYVSTFNSYLCAPELRTKIYYPEHHSAYNKIGFKTDYYAIGRIVRTLFGRRIKSIEEYDVYGYRYKFSHDYMLEEVLDGELELLIEEFLDSVLNEDVEQRIASDEELILKLNDIRKLL